MRRAPSLVAVALVVFHASLGHAQDAQTRAARAFQEGEQAFAAGDYRRAAAAFEEANAIRPHGSALMNAARARQLAGDLAKAANEYARVARDGATQRDRNDAKDAIATLAASVGRLAIQSTCEASTISVDGQRAAEPELYVMPGEHVAECAIDGHPVRARAQVAAGDRVVVVLARPATPSSSVAAPAAVDRGGGLPPFVFAAGAAATAIATGVTVWSAVDLYDQKSKYDRTGLDADFDDGLAKQRRTNVLVGVSVGLGIVTGVLALLTDWRAPFFGGTRAVSVDAGGVRARF